MILVNLELSSPCPLLSPWQVSLRLKRLWIWWKYPVSWCLRQQHQWKQQQQLVNNDPRGTRSNECTCLHLQQRWWRMESTNSQIQPEVAQRIETKNLCHITTYLKSKEWFLISNLFNLYKSRENIFFNYLKKKHVCYFTCSGREPAHQTPWKTIATLGHKEIMILQKTDLKS